MTEPLRHTPRQQRSERTLARIIDAADQVFGDVGYEKTTTTLIAKQAGLSVGAVYRFFPDKQAVAVALAESYDDKRRAVYETVAHEVLAGGNDTVERAVSTMLDGLADLNRNHPGYFVVSGHLAAAVTEPQQKAQAEALIAWFEMSAADLSRLDCEIMAIYTMAITRALLDRVPAAPRAKRKAYLDEAKFLIINYLRSHMPTPGPPSDQT